jgi:hypothetical protein
MNPDVVAETKAKAREYFKTIGTLSAATVIHERIADAFGALDAFLAPISAATAARAGVAGRVDDSRDRRPPGRDASPGPRRAVVLAGRTPTARRGDSRGPSVEVAARPAWPWLRAELDRIHGEILRTIARCRPSFATERARADRHGRQRRWTSRRVVPLHWVEDLDWKAYAIVWRLHVIDHLKQARTRPGARRRG